MKQAILLRPQKSQIIQIEPPPVQPKEVLVRVVRCGVCASELHPWFGDDKAYPRKLGHEVAGVVESVGSETCIVKPGMRVTGLFHEGFAEYAVANEDCVVELPSSLSWDDALGEPLGCVISAARRTPVTPGDTVAVIGVGFMGLLMLQMLRQAAPARLIAIDTRTEALKRAREFGADETFHPSDVPPEMLLTEWEKRKDETGLDVVVEASGTQGGLTLAGDMTQQHGVLSILGYHQGGMRSVDMALWNWKALTVINAHERREGFLMDCIRRGIALAAVGKLDVASLVTHRFPLHEVDVAFQQLHVKPACFTKATITL